jgi:hypothetical protein
MLKRLIEKKRDKLPHGAAIQKSLKFFSSVKTGDSKITETHLSFL